MKILLIILPLALFACSKPEPESFANYTEAVSWYQTNYKGETIYPDSHAISYATYYSTTKRKVLIVAFTSSTREYIHEGVPGSVWDEWSDSASKGRFYASKIRGRYHFRLRSH